MTEVINRSQSIAEIHDNVIKVLNKRARDIEFLRQLITMWEDNFESFTNSVAFKSIAENYYKEIKNGGKVRNRLYQKGGEITRKSLHVALHIVILLNISFILYSLYFGLQLDQVNCFAWYSPFASIFRNQIQNSWCTVLTSSQSHIDKLLTTMRNSKTFAEQLRNGGALVTAGVVTIKTFIKFVKGYNTQIEKIVKYIINKSEPEPKFDDAEFKADEVASDELDKDEEEDVVEGGKKKTTVRKKQVKPKTTTKKSPSAPKSKRQPVTK
jgi:hypothetical protein